jgi:hypothetical protein
VVRHPRGGAQVSTTTRQSATRDARCVVRGAWCVDVWSSRYHLVHSYEVVPRILV